MSITKLEDLKNRATVSAKSFLGRGIGNELWQCGYNLPETGFIPSVSENFAATAQSLI